jgi:uncharacterized protein
VTKAILVPGFNGTARQPLLVKLKRALQDVGLESKAITLKPRRPTPDLELEVAQLRKAARDCQVLVGRSFGGRVCARLAIEAPPRAVVLLGFPVRPPGKTRPLDEAALKALRCPTLILQGSEDELGSPEVLEDVLGGNPFVTLEVIAGAGHTYGKHEKAVIARTAQWLSQRLADG